MDSCQDGDIWLFYQSNVVAPLITQVVLVLVVVGLCDADVHEFEGGCLCALPFLSRGIVTLVNLFPICLERRFTLH